MSGLDAFLVNMKKEAAAANHIFPAYAACEAALESNWGKSRLALDALNFFGRKVSRDWTGGVIEFPTREWDGSKFIVVSAKWCKFPDIQSCFRDRMSVLKRLESRYSKALNAKSGEEFVIEVSKVWATDPDRAKKVLSIYRAHKSVLDEPAE